MRIIYFATLFLVLSVNSVTAEEQAPLNHYISIDQGGGLMVILPVSGEQAFLNRLAVYHSDLKKQRAGYADQVENTKFDVKDALITVIMPGGLLYAAAKQQQHNQAKADLLYISNQLSELKSDMHQLALKSSIQSFAMLN